MMDTSSKKFAPNLSSIPWIIRFLISLVFGWNVQCALVFLIQPTAYIAGFQLPTDLIGTTVIRSFGLLFLMWNIPYGFAAIQPVKWKICLPIAFIQQLTGVIGELWILSTLNSESIIRSSIEKFFLFDSVGLGILAIAWLLQYYIISHEREL